MNFGPGYIGFPIYSYRISDISIAIKWTYWKWGNRKWPYISDFRYIQTDMSIFSYGYIRMDISEMMMLELSEISEIWYIQISDMSRPICIFWLWTYRKWRHQKVSEFKHVHFRYVHFTIHHPFYPTPTLFGDKLYQSSMLKPIFYNQCMRKEPI